MVQLVHDPLHQGTGLLGSPDAVVQIGHVVARFVPVGVLADQAGDVGLIATRGGGVRSEELVQMGLELLRTAMCGDEAIDILRREQAVLPGIGLGEIEVDLIGVEARSEPAVAARAEKARATVEEVAPARTPCPEVQLLVVTTNAFKP